MEIVETASKYVVSKILIHGTSKAQCNIYQTYRTNARVPPTLHLSHPDSGTHSYAS